MARYINQARKLALEAYQDEVDQVDEEYEEGKISAQQRDTYLNNLSHNLESELAEIDRPIQHL